MIQEDTLELRGQVTVMLPVDPSTAILHAWTMLKRDLEKVFSAAPKLVREEREAQIVIRWADKSDECPNWPEAYFINVEKTSEGAALHIVSRDTLGLVFGILHVSEQYLGVDPYWFWGDIPVKRRESVQIPIERWLSKQPRVKYRGWFVNDEVCLIGWTNQYPPPADVWFPVFETLLRCGGNMVIPGTDLPKHGIHASLAQEMGLWVTHHHAEPLGAEMFLRAFPGKQASYKEHPELFEQLWREAIDKQCIDRVVWVLSFRGQGDKPFWENDPAFDTPAKRGEMISHVVRRQYDMICAKVKNPVCSMALYGEIAELYKSGHIQVPEGIIKIWADNGYGKMVSRRHGNLNFRVPALPAEGDVGPHGVYYHVTFHDLQASNHLTMQPVPPSLVQAELEAIEEAGAMEYLLVNCGNIRQHLYPLDLLRRFWQNDDFKYETVLRDYIVRLFGERHADRIGSMYKGYWENAIAYGPHEDDRAGDEFYHHPARLIAGHWLQGRSGSSCAALHWATGELSFPEQVLLLRDRCLQAVPNWRRWMAEAEEISASLNGEESQRLQDHLLFHGKLHLSGCLGFYLLCESFLLYNKSEYAASFVRASQSLRHYNDAVRILRQAEQGRWSNFYRADWLTNITLTAANMDTVRRFVRMHGDSPDFFLWYKAYLMPETEKHIYLENTHRNPLSDDELALRLEEHFGLEDQI